MALDFYKIMEKYKNGLKAMRSSQILSGCTEPETVYTFPKGGCKQLETVEKFYGGGGQSLRRSTSFTTPAKPETVDNFHEGRAQSLRRSTNSTRWRTAPGRRA